MERRQSPRIAVRLPVAQVVADTTQGQAEITDLSESGLCVEPLPGETFDDGPFAWLQVELPAEHAAGGPIRALGELCGRRDRQRSYRIKYIYPRDRRRYEAFVRSVAERAHVG